MKSWRSRAALALATGGAAALIPLTATTASAVPPPGTGWHLSGGFVFDSKAECERAMYPNAKANGYNEVWCDGNGGHDEYEIYYRK
jgi:hypothetical protein